MLRLEFPNETHQEMYEEMIEEWRNYEKIPTSPSLLFQWENFVEFLKYIKKSHIGDIDGKTPSTLYFWIGEWKITWAIDIRHNLEHPKIKEYSGHIGYGIRPSERKKWHATELLRLGLWEAKKIGIDKVLISCHPENIASEKVILKNGWEYFETLQKEGKIYKKYWITL